MAVPLKLIIWPKQFSICLIFYLYISVTFVVGKKLNFEVPIFGITMQGINPTWSIVTFDEMSGGYNYLKGVPGEMKQWRFVNYYIALQALEERECVLDWNNMRGGHESSPRWVFLR